MVYSIRKIILKTICLILSASFSTSNACDFEYGLELFNEKSFEQAATVLKNCTKHDLSKDEAYFYLGIIARNQNKLAESLAFLAKAASLNSSHLNYQLELAVALEWTGDLRGAREIYSDVLSINRNHVGAKIGFARMEHWMGNVNSAITDYTKVLEELPTNIGAKLGLGFALLSDVQLQESEKAFNDVIQIDPNSESALSGLKMLENIRKNIINISFSRNSKDNENDIHQLRVGFSRQKSYKLKWGFEIVDRENFTTPPPATGVPLNRAIRSSTMGFFDIKWRENFSTYLSYRTEEISENKRQDKLQIEGMFIPTNQHRFFVGASPAYIDSDRINLLTYGGYIYKPNLKTALMVQLFSSDDRDFLNSDALSISLTKNYGLRNYFQLGASYSTTSETHSQSGFGGFTHYLNREFALKGSLVKNFSSNENNITIGLLYEF